jgi:hypothetical protein
MLSARGLNLRPQVQINPNTLMPFDHLDRQNHGSGQTDLRLVSIHIPKTAGTSFRLSLQSIYGKRSVIRLDVRPNRDEVWVNEKRYHRHHLPRRTHVIHGHFSPTGLAKYFDVSEAIPVITWLRDPVERVISHYFYLAKMLVAQIKPHRDSLDLLKPLQRSLLEYAQLPLSCNQMSHFLEGAALDQFKFVGFVESYNHDLQRLSQVLGWPATPEFQANKTSHSPPMVDDETIQKIRALNQADVDLYQRALELKANGYWSPQ